MRHQLISLQEMAAPVWEITCGCGWAKVFATRQQALISFRKHAPKVTMKTISDSRVYVLEAATGQMKIGVAADVESRVQAIRANSPVPLTIVARSAPMARQVAEQVELALHDEFRTSHLHSEWFEGSPAIIAAVDTLDTSRYRMATPLASQVDTDVDASWTPAGASPLGDREETR